MTLAAVTLALALAQPEPEAPRGELEASRAEPEPPEPEASQPEPEASQPEPEASQPEPEPEAPRPRAPAVFATTPSDAPTPARDEPIGGGYWSLGEGRKIRPPDGQDQIIAGSIVLPVGVLNALTGAIFTYAMHPSHCPAVPQAWFGMQLSTQQCRGLLIFNAIRVGYGSLQAVTGAVLLGIGLHRRARYRKAKARGFALTPVLAPQQGYFGGDVRLRF